jgi:hypothetical protein
MYIKRYRSAPEFFEIIFEKGDLYHALIHKYLGVNIKAVLQNLGMSTFYWSGENILKYSENILQSLV